MAAPMAHEISAVVDIAAEIDEVFRWISEPAFRVRWISGLISSTETTATGFTAGAGFLEVMEMNGRRYELDVIVTAVEAPIHLGQAIAAHGAFTAEATYRLSGDDGVTGVEFTQSFTYHHWVARLLGRFITRGTQQMIDGDFARLKRLLEDG